MMPGAVRRPGGARGRAPALPVAPAGAWIVALPAWGERYVGVLLRSTLPALAAAARGLSRPVRVMLWTDRADDVRRVLLAPELNFGAWVDLLPVPGPDGAFESLSNCHRQALAAASGGDRVLLLTADMVLSREVLATCEAQISSGKRMVACCAMRALEDAGCPVDASGRELLGWAWDNRHSMTRDCTWPDGRSYDVWRMYFEKDGEVAARVFLPHPLACVPAGRRLSFAPTIDVNLVAGFSRAETHMITQPEEGAVVELSPPDKDYLKTTTMQERMINTQHSCPPLVRCTNARHRMFWEKKVVIRGTGGDCGDGEMVRRVLG